MSDEIPPSNDTGVSGWWSRLFQGRADEIKTREEIAGFLEQFKGRGVLAPEEYAMLQGVLEVSETQVREIMVPRSHMVVLPQATTPDEVLLKTIVESGSLAVPGDRRGSRRGRRHSAREGSAQAIRRREHERPTSTRLMRPAVFIPESKRLNTLLTEFRESHNHMAIVVDEYGGVSGLATIEDVLEQIVGRNRRRARSRGSCVDSALGRRQLHRAGASRASRNSTKCSSPSSATRITRRSAGSSCTSSAGCRAAASSSSSAVSVQGAARRSAAHSCARGDASRPPAGRVGRMAEPRSCGPRAPVDCLRPGPGRVCRSRSRPFEAVLARAAVVCRLLFDLWRGAGPLRAFGSASPTVCGFARRHYWIYISVHDFG